MADKLVELQGLLKESYKRGDRQRSEMLIKAIEEAEAESKADLTATGKKTSEGRPIYKDAKGDYVTEKTVTVSFPDEAGNEVIVNAPTVYDGRIVPEADALDRVLKSGGKDPVTGRDLERFRDMDSAVKAAQARSQALGQEVEQTFRQEAPSTAIPNRVGEIVNERLEKIAQTAQDQLGSGKMQPSPWATTAFSAVKNIAAIPFEVVGEGAGYLLEKAAKEHPVIAKAVLGGLRDAAEFEKEHLNLTGAIKKLRKDNPDRMMEVDAITNLLMLATPPKPTKSLPSEAVGKSLQKSRMAFVNELLTDKTTKAARLKLADTATQEGKKIILNKNAWEKAVAEEVAKIPEVSIKKTLIQNKEAIKNANNKIIQDLDKQLMDSKATFSKNILEDGIDMAMKKSLSESLKNSPSTPLIMDIADQAKRAIAKHPNTSKGLWEARKEYDAVIKKNRPSTFDGKPDKVYDAAAKAVRREMNDFIAFYAPNKEVKKSLEKSSKLYSALEQMRPKLDALIKVEGTNRVEQALKNSHVVLSKYGAVKSLGVGTGVAMTAAALYYHQPMIAAIIGSITVGGGSYKLIRDIITAPESRELLKQTLQVVEKAMLVSKDKPHVLKKLRADRAAIWELYNASED